MELLDTLYREERFQREESESGAGEIGVVSSFDGEVVC